MEEMLGTDRQRVNESNRSCIFELRSWKAQAANDRACLGARVHRWTYGADQPSALHARHDGVGNIKRPCEIDTRRVAFASASALGEGPEGLASRLSGRGPMACGQDETSLFNRS